MFSVRQALTRHRRGVDLRQLFSISNLRFRSDIIVADESTAVSDRAIGPSGLMNEFHDGRCGACARSV